MPEYGWLMPYGRVVSFYEFLNIAGIWVCQVYVYASVTQGSEYAWVWVTNVLWQGSEYAWSIFQMVLNKSPVLNMTGVRICQGWEYARVT